MCALVLTEVMSQLAMSKMVLARLHIFDLHPLSLPWSTCTRVFAYIIKSNR